MNYTEIERAILNSRGNSYELNRLVASFTERMAQLSEILDRMIEEDQDVKKPKLFEHLSTEYSSLNRLTKIARAYA